MISKNNPEPGKIYIKNDDGTMHELGRLPEITRSDINISLVKEKAEKQANDLIEELTGAITVNVELAEEFIKTIESLTRQMLTNVRKMTRRQPLKAKQVYKLLKTKEKLNRI